MSAGNGPGDGDRFDRLLDELGELTDLLRMAFTQGPGELEGEEELEGPLDMWDNGTSVSVTTLEEFKTWRIRAATREDVSTPYFEVSEIDGLGDKIDAHVKLYNDGYQNLEELRATLGVGGFGEFVQELAKQASDPDMAGTDLIADELVDILEPSPSFFGINEVEGEIQISRSLTPFSFLKVYGYTWHIIAEPGEKLGLEQPEGVHFVIGEMSGREVNEQMAKAIDKTRGLELPKRYESLL